MYFNQSAIYERLIGRFSFHFEGGEEQSENNEMTATLENKTQVVHPEYTPTNQLSQYLSCSICLNFLMPTGSRSID